MLPVGSRLFLTLDITLITGRTLHVLCLVCAVNAGQRLNAQLHKFFFSFLILFSGIYTCTNNMNPVNAGFVQMAESYKLLKVLLPSLTIRTW